MKKVISFIIVLSIIMSTKINGQLKELELKKVTENIFVLYGNGGNIAFYITRSGIAVFDSGVFPAEGKKQLNSSGI